MLTDNYFALIPKDNEPCAYLVNADGTIIFTVKMNSLDPLFLSMNCQYAFFEGSVYSVGKDDVSKLMKLYHFHSMSLEHYVNKNGCMRMTIMMPFSNKPSNSLYYQFAMARSSYDTENLYVNLTTCNVFSESTHYYYKENMMIGYSVDIENKLYVAFNTLRDAILDISHTGTYVMTLNSSNIKKSNLLSFVKK